ncbi:hypothetical protein FOA43_002859 [Brettanomyces nanus]|uniref:NAD(P)-binding domain-containing protein n=1 Tax=Eeniella nana TaxID=13502 RepID=A0A875S8U1_EENNA|nr:uncharacterized protein FOA43_002859 [Brettanomyces nanus]QPG75504.1 hypothetical protein FOA43_002859 [Brettanomyces nanus]
MILEQQFSRSVLVTGGAGFIGSNFLRAVCTSQDYQDVKFTCIDKLSYVSDNTTKFIDDLLKEDNFEFIKADISEEYDLLYRLIVEQELFTDVIHFAAESSVDRSFEDPLFFTKNNVLAAQNLLECVRLIGNKRGDPHHVKFIHISTDEVYGEQRTNESAAENTLLSPSNPYSASKGAIDLIINAYIKSFQLFAVLIRSNNVYGYHQYPEKIIPMTLYSLCHRQPIRIHGDGHNKRRYLFIDDFVSAVLTVWNKSEPYEIYNVGSDDEVTNIDMVNLIIRQYKQWKPYSTIPPITYVTDRKFNDDRYDVDFTKIRRLGWKPQTTLQQGLDKVIRS